MMGNSQVFDSPKKTPAICEDLGQCLTCESVGSILATLAINNNNKVLHELGNILTLVFTVSSSSVTYH